jgi:hypothetical protein
MYLQNIFILKIYAEKKLFQQRRHEKRKTKNRTRRSGKKEKERNREGEVVATCLDSLESR